MSLLDQRFTPRLMSNDLVVGPHCRFLIGGVELNNQDLLETYVVETFTGFDAAEQRGGSTENQGEHGQIPDTPYYNQRTMTLSGYIRASNLPALNRMSRRLLDAFTGLPLQPMHIYVPDLEIEATNLAWNPSFEHDDAGTLSPPGGNFVNVDGLGASAVMAVVDIDPEDALDGGNKAIRVTKTAGLGQGTYLGGGAPSGPPAGPGTRHVAVPGETYLSCMGGRASQQTGNLVTYIQFYDATSTLLLTTSVTYPNDSTAMKELIVAATAPPGAASLRTQSRWVPGNSPPINSWYEFDSLVTCKADEWSGTVFTGDSDRSIWQGTPGNSHSILYKNYFWQPAVKIECRTADRPSIPMDVQPADVGLEKRRQFTLAFIAYDPTYKSEARKTQTTIPTVGTSKGRSYPRTYDYGYTSSLNQDGSSAEGANTTTVTNNGNFRAKTKITLYGPMTNITVANVTTGRSMMMKYDLSPAEVVVIDDIDTGEIMDDAGNDKSFKVDMRSDWITLAGTRMDDGTEHDGTNVINLYADGFDAAQGSRMTIEWMDTWI